MPNIINSKWFVGLAISCFFIVGIGSLIMQEPYAMAIPFIALIAIPLIRLIVTKTEDIYWLLLIVLPLSTEFNFTPSLGLDIPDEPLLIILSVAVLSSILYQPSQFRFIFSSPIFRWIMAIVIWMFVSLCYAPNQWLALKFILAKTWYILPLVLLTALIHQRSSNFKKTALYLCIPMLLVIIQALIRHSFYGFDFIAIKKTMGPFFRNHVNYSAMLVCMIPIGLLLHHFTKDLRNRNIIKAGIGIALLGLIFAYSRGAWLALLVGIMAYWLIKKNILGKAILLGTIAIAIGLIVLITNNRFMQFAPEHDQTIFHENFSAHLNATIGFKDISNAERFHRWVAGIRMVAKKPWTGFGANSFYNNYQPYTAAPFKTWVSNNPEHSTVHNYFLLIALEQGIPALVLFIVFFIYLLMQTQALYHQFQNNYYREIALALGIVLMMIASLNFTSDLIETDKIGGIFWLSTGILIALLEHQKIEKASTAI
jgi:O-antigen ligase